MDQTIHGESKETLETAPKEHTDLPVAEATEEASAASVFSSPDFSETKAEPPKKAKLSRFLKIGLPVLSAILILFNWNAVAGFCIKNFGSDSDYLVYCEAKTFEDANDDMSTLYSAFKNFDYSAKQASSSKIEFAVSDDFIDLLSTVADNSVNLEDLSWLNDLSFITDAAYDGEKMQIKLGAEASGDRLITGDMIMNFNSGKLLITVPELNDEVLSFDLASEFENANLSLSSLNLQISMMSALIEKIQAVLPDEEVLNDLFSRYLEVAFETLDNVTSDERTIKIGNIEEDCTVLRFEINQEVLLNMAEAILKEARDDEEIIKILQNLVSSYFGNSPALASFDISATYSSSIDELIKELDKSRDNIAEYGNQELFTMRDYIVDHRVVGRAFEVGGEEIFRYITLHDGDNFTFELIAQNSFEISGSGTNDDGIINAKFTFSATNKEIFTLSVTNFDSNKALNGYLCGTFKFTPSNELMSEFTTGDHTVDSSIQFLKPSLEIACNEEKNHSKLSVSLYSRNEKLVGISTDSKYGMAPYIEAPSGREIDATNPDELKGWVNSLDFDSLADSLRDADAPDIVIDAIKELEASIASSQSSYVSSEGNNIYSYTPRYESFEDSSSPYSDSFVEYEDYDF